MRPARLVLTGGCSAGMWGVNRRLTPLDPPPLGAAEGTEERRNDVLHNFVGGEKLAAANERKKGEWICSLHGLHALLC